MGSRQRGLEKIRKDAQKLLARFRVGSPPVPIEEIARALDVSIRREPADEDLSGFLYRDPKRSIAVIGLNSKHPRTRQRFTIGHELGHFLLHPGDGVHVDRRFRVRLSDDDSSTESDSEEREANIFAAEILMPERLLAEDLATIELDLEDPEELKRLAARYDVSTQAITFRLANLGYLKL